MGFCIYANGSDRSFDGGMGGFMFLRINIAKAWDREFGEHYATLRRCVTDGDYGEFNKKTNKILSDPRFKDKDKDVLDFLFASDCEGEISHRTCKKIYDLIKGIDFSGRIFTASAGKAHSVRGGRVSMDCYRHRRKMRWC